MVRGDGEGDSVCKGRRKTESVRVRVAQSIRLSVLTLSGVDGQRDGVSRLLAVAVDLDEFCDESGVRRADRALHRV